ncbi:MAG: glycosyltransferase, partial [Planctomycetota bacterium]
MARSIVVWGGPPYLGPANSTHSEMARAFRELGHEVLYLELEGDPAPFREACARSPGPVAGTALAPGGVTLARIPKVALLPYALFGPSHFVNARLASRQLRRLDRLLELDGPVVIHRGWFTSRLVGVLEGARHVYDCVDDHLVSEEVVRRPMLVRRVTREEGRLLEAADLTVCVSEVLAEGRRRIARRCVVLPNAARAEDFDGEFPEPGAISHLPRPRALFVGRVGPKVDTDLIAVAARRAPSVAWVLAGEVRGVRLDGLPSNVHALGTVAHRDVPAIARHCDVGIAPLKLTPWNRASSQLKFGDYMAAGLPVVSTALPVPESL